VGIDVRIKRAYQPADPADGCRVLIDHVWPRGVSRDRANLDEWARQLAPSDERHNNAVVLAELLRSN
jgi:uncharacterized protein YeaO (DUF488 family)